MALSEDDIEALAMKHEDFGFGQVDKFGYTTHGFGPDGLRAFVAEVRAQDTALIRQLSYYLDHPALNTEPVVKSTLEAARARLKEIAP